MSRSGLLVASAFLLWEAASAAFVPQFRQTALSHTITPTTAMQYQFNPARASEIDRPLRRLTPDCVWVKETDEYRATECAEGDQCSLQEIDLLIDALHHNKEKVPFDDDMAKAQGREELLRILQLQRELGSLRSKLPDNAFVISIKRGEEEEWEGHWFDDYLHHDDPKHLHGRPTPPN